MDLSATHVLRYRTITANIWRKGRFYSIAKANSHYQAQTSSESPRTQRKVNTHHDDTATRTCAFENNNKV